MGFEARLPSASATVEAVINERQKKNAVFDMLLP
jgi:hypothetical protein